MLTAQRLPVRLAPLVGREDELRDVLGALSGSRLLTLTGPGGTGKTRLALAASAQAQATFAGGAWWVELAPIRDGGVVAQEVASTLGVPDSQLDPAVAIAEHLRDEAALLVLDNCEHLTEAVAQLAEQLLTSCPALSVLATSREVLGVEGERSWPVPPLSLPPLSLRRQAAPPSAAALAEFDAVKLFEQRAQLTAPSFRLSDDNAAAVLQVCRRLDGLPLAIELAAARMRILSAPQLAERLDDVFGLLVGGARSAPARHQALRATLDWSHDLLDDAERAALRRLSVFAGGCTLAAAEHVLAGEDIPAGRVLELLARLADKSLLTADHTEAGTRFQLLQTVREYARERLARAGETDQMQQTHLAYFIELVAAVTARIDRGEELERDLDRLDAEKANVRAALDYAREHGDATAALRLTGPLGRYAHVRGNYHEVRQWMDAAVTMSGDSPPELRAAALQGSGRLAMLQCDYVPAVRRLEAALRLYRDLADGAGIAATLRLLGGVAREQGRYARSLELHGEGLRVSQAAGDLWAVASAHGQLGFVLWLQGAFEEADAESSIALDDFRELSDTEGIASSLLHLAIVARYRGDAAGAASLLGESRSLAERIDFSEGIAWTLEQLGLLALDAGDPAARDLLARSLQIHYDLRDRWRACSVLEGLAALRLSTGEPAAAVSLLAAAAGLRTAIGTIIAPSERPLHDQTEAAAREQLGPESFAAAWRQGQAAATDDVVMAITGRAPRAVSRPHLAPPVQPQAAGGRSQAAEPAAPGRAAAEAGSGSAGSGDAPLADGPLRIRALGAATVHRGDVQVTAADWGYAKPRELLFLLASSPPLTRDQIGAALWPDLPRDRLANALHSALRGVRRALGDASWVTYSGGRYEFNAEGEHECDVATFQRSLAAARRARPAAAALPDLQRAVAAYGGEFLAGLACGEWASSRRDELARSFESALLAVGRLHVAAGRLQPAAAAFRRAVAHEPLNETAHRELMQCWAGLGETARAVRHYHELAEQLRTQLGVPPDAETTALFRRLAGAG